MAEFASIRDLKSALEIDQADVSRDTQLASMSSVASALLIDFMNRDPRLDEFVETVDGRGTTDLWVSQYPIIEVAEISLLGPGTTELLSADSFSWSENLIFTRGRLLPRGRGNVRVVYSAGLDPLPKTLSLAAIYTVRALITAAKLDLNATGESWAGVSSTAWDASGPGVVPVAARTILQNYVRRA